MAQVGTQFNGHSTRQLDTSRLSCTLLSPLLPPEAVDLLRGRTCNSLPPRELKNFGDSLVAAAALIDAASAANPPEPEVAIDAWSPQLLLLLTWKHELDTIELNFALPSGAATVSMMLPQPCSSDSGNASV